MKRFEPWRPHFWTLPPRDGMVARDIRIIIRVVDLAILGAMKQ